jgi:AraC-like DNA-binding protein
MEHHLSRSRPPADPLLELLRSLRLAGGVFLEAEFTAPWCVGAHVGPEDCRAFFDHPSHVISYHYVAEGRCRLGVAGHADVELSAGDIVLLPRNDPHRLGSSLDVTSVDAEQLLEPGPDGGLARIVHGGGGERTRILCGFLASDAEHPSIAALLPPALTLTLADDATGAWIKSSFHFGAQEVASGGRGTPAILARLSELLFIEAVRQHVATLPDDRRGWLAGVGDPIVVRALALLHGEPSRAWTTEALARAVGASRSSFAERFTALIGAPPMRYLTRQRMQSAASRLRESRESIAAVGFAVGYESEAAFSRAFKREFGESPAAWRLTHVRSAK